MSKRRFLRRLCSLILTTCALPCLASVESIRHLALNPVSWQTRQLRIGNSVRDLSSLPTASTSCEVSRPPEALATPDPLLASTGSGDKVAVSFIVGADGQVHSPVILESAGSLEDGNVLDALRSWRYRPALCNAAPAESESRVEFSSR